MNIGRFILSYVFLFTSLCIYPYLILKKKWDKNKAQYLLLVLLFLSLVYNITRGSLVVSNNTFTMFIPIYYFMGFFLDKKRRIMMVVFIALYAVVCYFLHISSIDLLFGVVFGTICILLGSVIRNLLYKDLLPEFIESLAHTILLFFVCIFITFLLRIIIHFDIVIDEIRNIFIIEYCIIFITINLTFALLEKIFGINKTNNEEKGLIRLYYKKFCKLAVVMYFVSMFLYVGLFYYYEKNANIDLNQDGNISKEEKEYGINNKTIVNIEEIFFSTTIASEFLTGFIIASFVLVYITFKKTIYVSLNNINENLSKITSGDYDVLCKEDKYLELEKLSNSINVTVDVLKKNIKEVEEKNKKELDLARKIQVSQFPIDIIDSVGYEIFAKNVPALDVSGDFYDYIKLGSNNLLFLIADVSGKGIAASMFMMRAIQEIRKNAIYYVTLEEIVTKTNLALCENNNAMVFVTAIFCMLDIKNGKLSYINAGHNPMIYNGRFLETKNDRILGIDEKAVYHKHNIQLKENDKLFLYTDGVVEARNTKGEFYGNDRLEKSIESINDDACSKEICNSVLSDLLDFIDGKIQYDDITELAFIYKIKNTKIKFDANNDGVIRGKNFLEEYLRLYDFNIEFIRNVKVVFDEICSNIVKYAYDDKNGSIVLKLDLDNVKAINDEEKGFKMLFEDSGKEFNSLEYEYIGTDEEEKISGGIGMMFCKKLCKDIKYKRNDNMNVLSLNF